MHLYDSLKWMFIGSVVIGIYLNAMNILAYRFSDLYFTSTTLIYSALFMASNMCILEVLMFYSHTGELDTKMLAFFTILSIALIIALKQQFLVDDEQWLKRMISHHSTAITTSKKILEKTENPEIKKLATDIVKAQEEEIKIMSKLLK